MGDAIVEMASGPGEFPADERNQSEGHLAHLLVPGLEALAEAQAGQQPALRWQ